MKRWEQPGDARFLTFSCYRNLPLFRNDAIKDCFVSYLGIACDSPDVQLLAWVVMPEHVHLLLLPHVERLTVRQFAQNLKRIVACRVLHRWRELDAPVLAKLVDHGGQQHFWQADGGYDHNVRSDASLSSKVQYVHDNPVAAELVAAPCDWLWSSARWYEGRDDYLGPPIAAPL